MGALLASELLCAARMGSDGMLSVDLAALVLTRQGPAAHPAMLTRRGSAASGRTIAAAAGGLDHEDVTRLHLGRADVLQHLDAAVGALDAVDAERAGFAASHAERRD